MTSREVREIFQISHDLWFENPKATSAFTSSRYKFHSSVASWLRAQNFPPLATCSITELEFVRVLAHATAYGIKIAQARTMLLRMKRAGKPAFTLIVDNHDVSRLPWVKTPNQTTGGYFANLAPRPVGGWRLSTGESQG